MSCPKCEPAQRRRRWMWWGGLLILVSAAALLDPSRQPAPNPAGTESTPSRAPAP